MAVAPSLEPCIGHTVGGGVLTRRSGVGSGNHRRRVRIWARARDTSTGEVPGIRTPGAVAEVLDSVSIEEVPPLDPGSIAGKTLGVTGPLQHLFKSIIREQLSRYTPCGVDGERGSTNSTGVNQSAILSA